MFIKNFSNHTTYTKDTFFYREEEGGESARTPEQDLHSHTSPHAKEFLKSDH